MSFLDNLKEEASFTETLNGAKTHSTSGDACLDLFAVAGGIVIVHTVTRSISLIALISKIQSWQ